MKTVEIKIYEFSELSDEAKQKALEIYFSEENYFWGDEAIKSLKKFAEHFNCELTNWSIDFIETYRSEISFGIPEYMQEIKKSELKSLIKSMGSYDPKTLKGHGDCKFTGVCFDEDAADGARKAFFNGKTDIHEILMQGFYSWSKSVNKDCEYQFSIEGYAEYCEANEYMFYENGKMY